MSYGSYIELAIKAKTIRSLEENIEVNFCLLGLQRIWLDIFPKKINKCPISKQKDAQHP